MVSKARLDLPEPESPVTTINRSRGNSSDTFLRLWNAGSLNRDGGACSELGRGPLGATRHGPSSPPQKNAVSVTSTLLRLVSRTASGALPIRAWSARYSQAPVMPSMPKLRLKWSSISVAERASPTSVRCSMIGAKMVVARLSRYSSIAERADSTAGRVFFALSRSV